MYAEHVLHRVIGVTLLMSNCVYPSVAHPAHIGICLVFCGNLKNRKAGGRNCRLQSECSVPQF